MRTLFASSSLLFNLLFAAASASAQQAEQMPDGNWRDPAPSTEALKQLLAKTRANLVAFPAGAFDMGDWGEQVNANALPFDGSMDSKPLHKVQLSAFSISKYPVTYAEFDIFTAALRLPRINQFDVDGKFRKPGNPAGTTWQGAKDYCGWLAKQTGEKYDLPTEAQWEYAARSGGKRHVYATNNGLSQPGDNTPSFAQRDEAGGLVSVNKFPPNPAGIYGMGAGIRDWVNDWYDENYYAHSPATNPLGPESGTKHVLRGHFGSDTSAMTFKRWSWKDEVKSGTWTLYGKTVAEPNRKIPHTKYSGAEDQTFRCVKN